MANPVDDFPYEQKLPVREPFIQTRYWQILGSLTRGETVMIEDFDTEKLGRLRDFSLVALVSTYARGDKSPYTQSWMETFHIALSSEYAGRMEEESQTDPMQNVRFFPQIDRL